MFKELKKHPNMKKSLAFFMGAFVLAGAGIVSAATVNVCPINGRTGIFKATGPITVADRVLETPAFGGDPAGAPGNGPFWLAP